MADEADKLSWKKLGNIAEEQRDRFDIVFSPPGGEIVQPGWYAEDMQITLIDPKGQAIVVPLHEKPENLPESFAWARESLAKAAAEWDKIKYSDAAPLLDNFRQRGGILNLVQGNATFEKIWETADGKVPQADDETKKGPIHGQQLSLFKLSTSPLKEADFIITLSTNRGPTTLIHELTHAADHGISDSPLFRRCYERDNGRGEGFIVINLYNYMKELITKGTYTQEKLNHEMICRLHEVRHAYPEEFKRQCPLLEEFFTKVLYPTLSAQTFMPKAGERVASQEALRLLHDSKLGENGLFLNDQEKAELNKLRNQDLVRETDPKKKEEIKAKLAALIDGSESTKALRQTMDEIHQKMRALSTPQLTPYSDTKKQLMGLLGSGVKGNWLKQLEILGKNAPNLATAPDDCKDVASTMFRTSFERYQGTIGIFRGDPLAEGLSRKDPEAIATISELARRQYPYAQMMMGAYYQRQGDFKLACSYLSEIIGNRFASSALKQQTEKILSEIKQKEDAEKAKHPHQEFGLLLGPDGKNYRVPVGEDGKLIIPDSLKEKYPDQKPSNPDLLQGAIYYGRGPEGGSSMDKHNGLDYRDVGGKGHKPESPEPSRPADPLEAERQKKREEIRQQREYEAKLADKHRHSL